VLRSQVYSCPQLPYLKQLQQEAAKAINIGIVVARVHLENDVYALGESDMLALPGVHSISTILRTAAKSMCGKGFMDGSVNWKAGRLPIGQLNQSYTGKHANQRACYGFNGSIGKSSL
jgi:hypothetical protein